MSKLTYCPNKQRNIASALSFLILMLLSLTSNAVPPGNDNCSGALVIPAKGPFPCILPAIEITDATTTGDPTVLPQCQANVTRSIWYTFTPTNSEFYTFSTCPDETTVKDTVLAIYTNALGCSSPDTFGLVACADDSAGGCLGKAALTAPLASNVTYYVIAWQWSDAQITSGNAFIKLVVSKALPPPNDTGANAQPLTLNMPMYGSTLGANDNYETIPGLYDGLPYYVHDASGRDVVYSFTAPTTDTYSVRVYDYSSDPNDLVLYATSTCPPSGSIYTYDSVLAVANRTSYASTEELFCVPLQEGQLIYIVVDEDFLVNYDGVLSPGSTFRIEVNRCRVEQEDNSSPDTANALPCGVEGSLPAYDNDYYALGTFPAGSRLFALIDSSAATPPSFSLQIRTNTTAPLNFIQNATANNPQTYGNGSANLAGTILPGVPVFARLFDTVRKPKEPYRFYAVVQPPIEMANCEREPNNTYATATSATNNYDYFRGSLATSNDVDLFQFTASGGDLIFVSLDCDPLRDATPIMGRLELLDADGKSLLSVDTTHSESSTNSSLTAPASLSTAFYYRVADEGDFEFFVRVSTSCDVELYATGDYLLSISKNCFARASGLNTAPVLTNLSTIPATLEGGTVPLSGHIVDPDTGEAFTISINWGDGSDAETIQPGAGVYDFATSHLYADNGNFRVSLTVTDNNGGSVVSNLTAVITNVAPSLTTLEATTGTILEGGSFSLSGTFSDPGVLDTHTVAINWGDGSQLQTIARAAGVYDFASSHIYADNGNFPITLTLSDNNGGSVVSNLTAVVNNVAPTLTTFQATANNIIEGSSFSLSGTISDPGLQDTHTVAINWGDGSQVQTIDRNAGVYDFAASHIYSDNGTFQITLTISDNNAGSVVSNLTAVVNNAAPTLTALQTPSGAITEGSFFALSGTFSDPGVHDTHTVVINWGDGVFEAVNRAAGLYNFSTSHFYADNGSYPITLTLSDNNGGSVVSNLTAVITNAPPSITALNATTGAITEGSSFSITGTFSDPGLQDTHTVAINWGDGSQLQTINRAAGVYDFTNSHTYVDNGTFPITLTLSDNNSASVVSNLTAIVTNAAPSLTALNATTGAITEGSSFSVNGTFTDPGSLDTHTVAINWGDGSQLQTINRAAGVYDFSTSHSYADNGSYPITLTLSDNNSASVVSNLTAVVTNAPPSITTLNATTGAITEGSSFSLNGTFSDPGVQDTHTVVINWGDGSQLQTINRAAGVYDFTTSHTYPDNGTFPITLTITDNNNASVVSNLTAVVTNAAPTITALNVTPGAINEGSSVALSGTISDPGVRDTHTVQINWGDGSLTSTLNLAAGETTFAANHPYMDDNPTGTAWDRFSIAVTVSDNNNGTCSSNTSVVVSNLPPVFTSATLAPASILPNQSANLTVAFTDPGTSDTFTYSVNWGDGSAVETHATAQSFNLSHAFALANTNLSVNVTIHDDDGGSVSTNLPIRIQMPSSPRLSLNVSNGWYWVQVQGDPNVTYRLQASTNLPSWSDLVPLSLSTNGVAGVKITNNFSVPPRFLRAVFP